MRSTTYIQALERRAADAKEHAQTLFRMSKGDLGVGRFAPRKYLEWTWENSEAAYRIAEMILSKTEDIYLRDRTHHLSAEAFRAAKDASYDIDGAEDYYDNAETCNGCGHRLDASGMCTAPLSVAD